MLQDVVSQKPENVPPAADKFPRLTGISKHVVMKLLTPKFNPISWCRVVVRAAVPKAPIDEYDGLRANEHDVRPHIQQAVVDPIPKTTPPKARAENEFGRRVNGSDPSHVL
ncbi:MAG: hypothetical protein WBB88_14085 [Methyloceanibacter sp.]